MWYNILIKGVKYMSFGIHYSDMCTVKQLETKEVTKEDIKIDEELIDECIKNCDALIESIEKFKKHIEKYKK